EGVVLTGSRFLIGEQSIVLSGSDGSVGVYFRLPREGAVSTDGYTLVRAHDLDKQPGAIVAVDASQRGKMFVTADATGEIWVRHSTSEQTLLKLKPKDFTGRYQAVALSPREDGVIAVADDGRVYMWDISA